MDNKGLITSWEMLARKDLTPISKYIYSLIYFREQGQYGACTESAASMSALLGVSPRTIMREVTALEKAGYISKTVMAGRGWKLNTYDKMSPVTDCHQCQNVTTPMTDCHHTYDKLSPHLGQNVIQRKEEDKNKKKRRKEGKGQKALPFTPFSNLPDSNLKEALMDYAEVRKEMKSPIRTPRQEKILLSALEKHAPGDVSKQIAIIEQSIGAGWKSFYALKIDEQKPVKERGSNTWEQRKLIQ